MVSEETLHVLLLCPSSILSCKKRSLYCITYWYESAFLADLVASYLFEKASPIFRPTIYHGIYRDDGLVVFKGKKETSEIKDWLEKFQQTVNLAARNQHLKFTVEIWTDGANPPTPEKEDRVQIVAKDEFPFLDMKMSWSQEGDLQFGVFRKKG